MLAGRLADATGPFGWRGEHETIASHVGESVRRLKGTGLPPEDTEALVAYARTIAAPPRAPEPEREPKVERGRAIFQSAEAGCTGCHDPARGYSDGSTHDVSSRASGDRFSDFRTPPLRFVAATAPYFHDGRYGSLRELLVKTDGRMGAIGHLSEDDRSALEAFLRTL
jgi:cytochrome c peroxidase